MKSLIIAAISAALLSGCVAVAPAPPNRGVPDPSDPAAPQASTRPLRPNLVATTKVYLDPSLGQEAQKMEHGNMSGMAGMGGMQGMDHSKMPGMENKQPPAGSPAQSGGMQGMDHSKMPGMEKQQQQSTGTPAQQDESMKGMDHSKMQGMENKQPPSGSASPSGDMQGMDHSKMPGMTSSPTTKEALEKEMKKTSDEMKRLSDELKEKADEALQERPSPSPPRDQ